MGMSPEQRAADLYELWSKRWNDEWCLNPDEFDALVAAIRAAEDEALERAAGRLMSLIEACEGGEGDPNHPCPMCVAQDEAIDVIRSLKSKEGK